MKPFVNGTRLIAFAFAFAAAMMLATPGLAQVVINELHYHPADPDGAAEFIELHNLGGAGVDISAWTITGYAATPFEFPGGTILPANGYVVVAEDIALLFTLTGVTADFQWPSGDLSNAGETVILSNDLGSEIDRVTYDDSQPWATAPDGDGPSLELINPAFDNSSPNVWQASTAANGTPGAVNSTLSDAPVVLFEEPARFSIVPGALPQISVTFAEAVQNIAAGDLTVNGSAATSVTGSGAGPYEFSGFAAPTTAPIVIDLAAGLIEDLGSTAFAGDSWGHANVVINEIHYHPDDLSGLAEFIEVLNAGSIPADVSGWQLDFSLAPFVFPAATTIAAGAVTVVAEDPAQLDLALGGDGLGSVYLAPFQWTSGGLSNGGELITLNVALGFEADRVDYGDANDPPWPSTPDGQGPSLELIDPSIDNRLPVAWKASTGNNGTPGNTNSVADDGPVVVAVSPERGSLTFALTEVSVTFHEEVSGVVAGDLIVDGAAATGVTGSGAGPYVFTVPSPSSAQVNVTLGPGAIEDLDTNAFLGDSWQYSTVAPAVVINEIHYHPADSALPGQDPELLQFVEIYNNSFPPTTIDISGWRLTAGISFTFPALTTIDPDEYIVIAEDATTLQATVLTIPVGTQVFTWSGGNLENAGERVRLSDPFDNTVDSVTYNDQGEWIEEPDGTGPSLELINPFLLNQYAGAWQASAGTNGTPGEQNSVYAAAAPPIIAEVNHTPAIPVGGQDVTITARVSDSNPTFFGGQVQVCHRQDAATTVAYVCEPMFDDGAHGDGAASDGTFGAVVTGLADGQRMDFAIAARGGAAILKVAPRGHDCGLDPFGAGDCAGQSPSQVYLAKFSDAGVPTDFPSYHLVVTEVVRAAQIAHIRDEFDASVVHCQTDGTCEVHYNVVEAYRGRGSLVRHPHSYNILFPNDPVQSEMGFDLKRLLLLGMNPHRQWLGHDLFGRVGHPQSRTQFVRVVRDPVPHEGYTDWLYLNAERVDEDFMRSQGGAVTPTRFPDRCSDSDTVCTTDLDCPGVETCDNSDRGNIYRGRVDADLRYEGPTVDPPPCGGPYRLACNGATPAGYQKVTNEEDDVWTDIINLTDALTCSTGDGGSICVQNTYDENWESELANHLDIREFAEWFALQNVLVNTEGGIYLSTGDDYFVAFQDSLDHARMIAWDLDAITGSNFNDTIWRTTSDASERVIENELFAGYYIAEICRLLDNEFSVDAMNAAINSIPEATFTQPQSSENQGGGPRTRGGMITWVANRHTGITNQLSMQTTLTGIPASPYTDPDPVIALSGSLNQCGARRVLVNGLEADSYNIANLTGGGANWSHSFTLVPGVNNILVQTVDHDGAVIDFASDTVIYSPPGTGGGPASLKVTGSTRMVNTKTHTVRAELLDSLGNTSWQSWFETGTVSARRVSDQSSVPITVTVFETFNGGEGAGGPAPGEIFFYNGLGSVSFLIDDPVSVAGQDLEITVTVLGFSDSIIVTALDDQAPGLFKQLSGTISGADLTWDPSDGVIHLTGNVTLNGNLTINAGTLVMVDAGSPGSGTAVFADGSESITAIGTEANPIFMFATNNQAAMTLPQSSQNNPPSWRGFDHRGSGFSTYRHVFLTGAGNGAVTGHPRPIILGFFNSHGFDIADCVFADNPGKVLHGGGNSGPPANLDDPCGPTECYNVARSLFSRAGIGGEFFGGGHKLIIEDSWFTRNGRAPEPNGVDGDALHLDTNGTNQLMRGSIIADCGDDAIDHNASSPVIENSIIWDVRDKAASLTGGGITFRNVLVFNTGSGIRGGSGTVVVENSTIAVGSSVTGSGPATITESILTSGFNLGSCSPLPEPGNVSYTLGPNANHVACGTGNLSGGAGFQDPGNCDYSLQGGSQAADAGPSGGRIGWLGFPEGTVCVNDVECDDSNACTTDSCDAGACLFVPIDGCTPCLVDSECVDGDPCTADTCSGGVCTNPPGNDGATCDDGLACTDIDECSAGTCAGTDNCPGAQVCGPAGVCIVGQTQFIFQNDDTTYFGTQDTHIRQAAPGTAYGTLEFFEWDGEDPAPNANIGMIKFENIVGPGLIPQGTLIDTATLTIVIWDPTAGTGGAIHPLLVFFDEAETWTDFGGLPALGTEYGPQIATTPTTNGTHVIDITSAVQDWINNPTTNFGLIILPTTNDGISVRSSEYVADPALRPILTVDFGDTGCVSDIDCNDGAHCNGVETCNMVSGTCQAGTPPSCDDGVSCTVDSCNETNDNCDNVPTNSLCDDLSFCTGTETCSATLDCQPGTPVDCSPQLCSDPLAQCVDCLSDTDCPVGEVCTVGAGTCAPPAPPDNLPILIGDDFNYFKGTVEPSPGGGGAATTDWTAIGFDDSTWLNGATGFGYGPGVHEAADPDTNTLLDGSNPPAMSGNYASVYFRREFNIDNPAAVDTMTLTVAYDDAFVAYINGVEVLRTGLLAGLGTPPTFDQLANAGGGTNHEGDTDEVFDLTPAISQLFPGTNVLSFQLHNVTLASSDAVLRPELTATFTSLVCTDNSDCIDTAFCNGTETCNLSTNLCEAGTPVDCDDGTACTTDTCNEVSDGCDNVPNDALCEDGNACTVNTCNVTLGCQGVPLDCDDGASCTIDTCDSVAGCQYEEDCPVGEVCNVPLDVCEVPTGPQAGDVIISGFNPSGSPEWIELFNTTGQSISLEDLNLLSRVDIDPGDGTLDLDWQLSDVAGLDLTGATIAPYSFYLVGETGTSPLADLDVGADGLDLATGEGGTAERAISLEVTVEAVPVHMDYVLYGNHDGSDTAAIPPGDLAFGGFPGDRVEVTRTVIGTASFAEGELQRISQTDLHAGYDVEGYYTDDTVGTTGFPPGVWTSSLHPVSTITPRNSGSPAVPPGGTPCTLNSECDDLDFCNGVETCNTGTNLCESGTPPNCDDSVACTVDSCNETTDTCENSLCPMTVTAVGGRYLAVTPPAGLAAVSLRVDSASVTCLPQYVDAGGFLVAAPVFQTSAAWGTVFVGDREVLPSTTYDVSAEVAGQVVGQDSATTWLWGDANNIDGSELFDILCVQDGFAAIFTQCTLEGDDVRAGIPDRLINLDDLMAVLDGVALVPYPDTDPCSGPPPASIAPPVTTRGTSGGQAAVSQARPGENDETGPVIDNLITLVPRATAVAAGEEVAIDVFASWTSDLRGYQVALEVIGGSSGSLLTKDLAIDTTRDDFAFADLTSFRAMDPDGLRIAAALPEGGIDASSPVYLGTFVLEATDNATGVFRIRFLETETFLRNHNAEPLTHQLGDAFEIVVPVEDDASGGTTRTIADEAPTLGLQRR